MAIEVKIKKKIGSFLLDVEFSNQQDFLGILGASGCGKSMTLKCIAGIEKPDSGRIVLNGRVLFDSEKKVNVPVQERNVGYMFQNYALFPTMTIEENIAAGIGNNKRADKGFFHRQKAGEKKEMVARQIKRFHLEGMEKRYPSQLSGGQQQRVALARLMAYEPEIIMLDEPFSAIDSYLKDVLQQELMESLKEYPGDIIMVSHSRDEIFRFCKNLMIMEKGKVAIAGRTRAIFKEPKMVAAARLTGCKNISRIQRVDAHRVKALDWGNLELSVADVVKEDHTHIGIRGHRLLPRKEAGDNCMETEVVHFSEAPFENQYQIRNKMAQESSLLWWMQEKQGFEPAARECVPKYLYLPEDELMLLVK